MKDENFGVEESAALLHVIFTSYTELSERSPALRSDRSGPPCKPETSANRSRVH